MPNEQWFHISTPSENDVNFTIKRGDGSAYYADMFLMQIHGQPELILQMLIMILIDMDISLLPKMRQNKINIIQHGFIIEADQEIYVSTRFISQSNNHGGH